MPNSTEEPGAPPRRSPWRRAAPVVLGIVLLAWPVGWIVGSRIARGVLVREAERRFDAQLEVGSVHLLPPFWLVASDLALVSELGGERVAWLRVGALHATLLGWPVGGVPPVRVTVDAPVLTVVRTPDGVVDLFDRWRGGDALDGAPVAPGDGTARPVPLPIKSLTLAGARLDFIDRTAPGTSPASAAPLGVGGFAASARLDGRTIDVSVAGGDAHLKVDGRGAFDLATRTITIAALDARLRVAGAAAGESVDVAVEELAGSVQPSSRSARIAQARITLAGEPAIVASDVHASIVLGDGRLDARDVAANVAGGSVRGTLALRWDEEPSWQASGSAADLRLADLARRFPQLGGEGVQGLLSASGSFSGALAARDDAWLASLAGSGRMRVREGRFYTIPLVAQLLQQAGLSDQGVTLTEASAVFRVADGDVLLDEAALGSTALGVQGHGEVGFDGRVQLDMVVMPFGSWRSAVERGNVPIVGGALASLAGKAQQLVGKASGALYAFRITGTVQDPRLTPVPVPALTKSATDLFGRMAAGSFGID
ncbi:AsmA-like C-terminal region-containing protein [Candidatus Binatia bacterium]|nr:AsmA-like C-terminal region-containing protein [Candidatus Binatia bacterium]